MKGIPNANKIFARPTRALLKKTKKVTAKKTSARQAKRRELTFVLITDRPLETGNNQKRAYPGAKP